MATNYPHRLSQCEVLSQGMRLVHLLRSSAVISLGSRAVTQLLLIFALITLQIDNFVLSNRMPDTLVMLMLMLCAALSLTAWWVVETGNTQWFSANCAPPKPELKQRVRSAALVIEVRISPQDIQDVQILARPSNTDAKGSTATNANVILSAYRTRATPQVAGRISDVGTNRLIVPATSVPYYLAHITVSEQTLKEASTLAGQPLILSPGIQAEVFMATRERTAFRYLLDPILDGVRRSMRER
jgi:hypothetical protein